MASSIKGITVEIGGDTTKLDKALKNVNTSSRSLQGELKKVNSALKLDPTNVNLIKQKQDILTDSIGKTNEKLEVLKSTQSQVQKQFEKGDITSEQYREFQREIEATRQKLIGLNKEAQQFGTSVSPSFIAAKEHLTAFGTKTTEVGQKMLPLSAGLVAVGVAASKVGNDFEAAMSRVKAISGATGEEFEKLKQQALDLGQSTAFSAQEVATAQENLASAGFSTNEIMQALPGLLDLAASSGEDLATSSDIAASTLRGFGLDASQAAHVADVLAKNAADTNAAVADTGEAMKYVAPAAKAAGLSLEEVTAAIGVMANSGIQGSQAGTTLRSALTKLASPSKEAAGLMEQLGFKAFDSEGKMLSLSDIINNLQTSTSGLTDEQKQNAIATIFGQEAMSGMLTLMDAGGNQINTLADGLKNADGAASNMAKTMQDNTKSALEEMGGALETASIKIQESLAPIITYIANFVANLATAFSNLSPTIQKIIVLIGAVVAAIGPALIIVGQIAIGISALMGAFIKIKEVIAGLTIVQNGLNLSFLACPLTWIVIAIAAAVAAFIYFWNTSEGFRNFWIGLWEKVKSVCGTVIDTLVNFFTVTIPNAWNSLVAFFEGIPEWFSNLWNEAVSVTQSAWSGVTNFFTTLWEAIKSIFNMSVSELTNYVTSNFGGAISGVMQIFEGLTQYFQGYWEIMKTIFLGAILLICDLFTGDFTKLKEDAINIWNNLKEGLSLVWEGIKNIFNGALTAIVSIVTGLFNNAVAGAQTIWNAFVNFLGGIWTAISTGISTAWNGFLNTIATICNNILTTATTIWNNIVNTIKTIISNLPSIAQQAFTSVCSAISSALSGLGNIIQTGFSSGINFIKGLPKQALTWGKDFIQGLIDGIKSMIGKVTGAVEDVANKIRSYLHFSVPDVGPLTDYETWMPDFMEGLSKGIENSKNKVVNSIKGLATDMNINLNSDAYKLASAGSSDSNISTDVRKEGDIIFQIENFNNNRSSDLKQLMQEAEYIRKANK